MEKNTMLQKPRPLSTAFFHWKELMMSLIQGLITGGILATYRYAVSRGDDEPLTRIMVFFLITANILLTLVNRSFYYSMLTTIRYQNNRALLVIGVMIALSAALICIVLLADSFGFVLLNASQLAISIVMGMVSVSWFELLKWRTRKRWIMNALRFSFSHPVKVNAHLVPLFDPGTECSRLGAPSDESNMIEIRIDDCVDGCWRIELEWEYENNSFHHHQTFDVKNHQLSP